MSVSTVYLSPETPVHQTYHPWVQSVFPTPYSRRLHHGSMNGKTKTESITPSQLTGMELRKVALLTA